MNKLQQNIAALLARDGISENVLAQRYGMNLTTLNRIIRGEILDPWYVTVAPLASYAQTTVDVLKRGDIRHPYVTAAMPQDGMESESELRNLRERVDTLSIALMGLLRVTAQYRPVEAEALVAAIRGNRELDMSRHGQLQAVLKALEAGKNPGAKPSVRARAKPASR
jgi:transcriptional regulator with XRE-family HTH domain